MATTNRIVSQTLAVGGSASSATVNSSGQQKVVISTQVSALSNPGQIRVDVWDATEGRVLKTVVFNVNDTKNVEVSPAPLSYSVTATCTLGSGTVVVNELTGSEQEGLTLELDDLGTGFLAASAAGRATMADDFFTPAEFVAGAGGKFAANCMDGTACANVFPNGAIPVAKVASAPASLETVVADPGNGGAIAVTNSGTCALNIAGAGHNRTLADPGVVGTVLCIVHDAGANAGTVTCASDITQTPGQNVINFTAGLGETVVLVGVSVSGAPKWRVLANPASLTIN